MESLLSLSFDHLSSNDNVKVRKGLRQLEGVLAQLCLSHTSSARTDRRKSVVTGEAPSSNPKELAALKADPAFCEYFKLQEGFEFNSELSQRMIIR